MGARRDGRTGGGDGAAAAVDPLAAVAVIVPVAPGDEAWRALLADLATLPPATEVVFAATVPLPDDDARALAGALAPRDWRWIAAPRGRARQLNAGVHATHRPRLWFLHADSRFAPDTVDRLRAALRRRPDALHFFDLAFADDGPWLVRLNAIGARLRSRWLGMPFGDQGLCLPRDVWLRAGGFDEEAPYGEDHLLVWRARQLDVALNATGGRLRTSARRYREQGWARTTRRHLWLTARQALPEWLALLRARLGRAPSARR